MLKIVIKILFLVICFINYSHQTLAQCNPVYAPDSMQFRFQGGSINATAIRGNYLYVGGSFTSFGKYTGHLSQIDTLNGKPKNTWTYPRVLGGLYFGVKKIITDGMGGIIIVGDFNKVGDSTRNNIAQIDSNGHVTAWNPNANNVVNTIVLVNNTVYVGGLFTTIGGATRNNIAALNLHTGLANTWNPNANTTVEVMDYNNGYIYVGGDFVNIGGVSRNYLAKLDTLSGSVSSWNPNPNNSIFCFTFNGGLVYVGGAFTSIGGATINHLVALDSGTGLATTFNPNANNTVTKIVINGTYAYVSGYFSNIGTQTRYGLAEISLSTGNATGFNPIGATYGYFNNINDFYIKNNRMSIGGNFNTLRGHTNYNYAIVDLFGDSVTTTPTLADGVINSFCYLNGKLLMGGSANSIGYTLQSNAVAIDLRADTIALWNPQMDGEVEAIAVGPDFIYLGGSFSSISGYTHNNIAAVDTLTGFPYTGFNAYADFQVTKMLYSAGTLFLNGEFNYLNSDSRHNLGALDAITGATRAWYPSAGDWVWGAINDMVTDGTNIYIGGNFTTFGGYSRNNLLAANYAGVITSWNPNPDGVVNSMAVDGSRLIIGGNFNNIGPVFAPRLAKLDLPSGIASSTWTPYPNAAVNLVKPDNNVVYLTGTFNTINGDSVNTAGIVDTTTIIPSTWSPGDMSSAIKMEIKGNRLYYVGNYSLSLYLIKALPDTIAISGNSNICSGSTTTFTSTTNVVGGTYQWRVNGINVGTGSGYSYIPTNGDHITCTNYIPTGTCYTTDSATSNVITITVNPYTTPYNHIIGDSVVCAGTTISFTDTNNITGAMVKWYVNSVMTHIGNTYSYIPANGDIVKGKLITPAGCYTSDSLLSNPISMVVNPNLTPHVTVITAHDTVCDSNNTHFIAHSNISGESYQWYINNVAVGISDSIYSYFPVSGDTVLCQITTPAMGCYTNTSDSNFVVMTVIPNTVPLLIFSPESDTICSGINTTFIATPSVSGVGYHWYINSMAVGLNDSAYTYIPTNGDTLFCIITVPTTGCFSYPSDSSYKILIVLPFLSPHIAIIASDTVQCADKLDTFFAHSNIYGANFNWYKNSTLASSSDSVYIYLPNTGDNVKCIITVPSVGCFNYLSDTSNSYTLTVNPVIIPTLTVTTDNNTICMGSSVIFTTTSSVVPLSYQWQVNGADMVSGTTSYTYTPTNGDMVKCITTMPNGCYSKHLDTSNVITMTVNPYIVPTIFINGPGIMGLYGLVNLTATVTNAGSSYLITWYRNGIVLNTSTVPSTVYVMGLTTDTITAKIESLSTGCYDTVTSNTIYVYSATGIEDLTNNSAVLIYPNPFIDQLTFKGVSDGDILTIYTMTGQLITKKIADTFSLTFTLKNMPNGNYMLRWTDKSGVSKRNFVITKE